MGYNDAARHFMLNALATEVNRVSLHSGDPGANGANELAGGTPAYARQIPTWGAPASGQVNIASIGSHNVPGGTTVLAVGFWRDAATPIFYGYAPLGSFLGVFTAPDAASDIFYAPGHGLVLNSTVCLQTVVGKVLPTGVVEFTTYYARDVTTDTFKLAATAGGAAINLTAVGSGILLSLVAETFPIQGVYTVSTGTALKIR